MTNDLMTKETRVNRDLEPMTNDEIPDDEGMTNDLVTMETRMNRDLPYELEERTALFGEAILSLRS